MVAAIVVCSSLANIVLLPRIGPRVLVASGMLAAAAGLAWLTRIGVHSGYAADVLPALLVTSAGLGFVMSPSMNTGTAGVTPSDAGVASAMVNTGQQSAARSARRCSTPWRPARPLATWPPTSAPGRHPQGGRRRCYRARPGPQLHDGVLVGGSAIRRRLHPRMAALPPRYSLTEAADRSGKVQPWAVGERPAGRR